MKQFLVIITLVLFSSSYSANATAVDVKALLKGMERSGECKAMLKILEFQTANENEETNKFVESFWASEAEKLDLDSAMLKSQCDELIAYNKTVFDKMQQNQKAGKRMSPSTIRKIEKDKANGGAFDIPVYAK